MAGGTPKRPALGKGLNSLLTSNLTAQNTSTPIDNYISLDLIDVNPYQPRSAFDEEKLNELAASIKSLGGLITPVTLRKLDNGRYQIIAGERRCRASRIAGLDSVPAYIRTADDQTMLEWALVENIQREDLDPIEIAISFQRMLEECNYTQEKLSERVGKKRPTVANYIRLLSLPGIMQQALRDKNNAFTMGHAKVIASIEDENLKNSIFESIQNENWSVRETEKYVKELQDGSNEEPQKPTKTQKTKATNDDYKDLEDKLKSVLNTDVKFSCSKTGKGKITIAFNNHESLQDIIALFDSLKQNTNQD